MLSERLRSYFASYPRQVRNAYTSVFSGPQGKLVLAHLSDTCGATETTARETELETILAEGRRQVWLVIQDVLSLSEADIREMQDQVSRYGGDDE